MSEHPRARDISTLEDVRGILDSSDASFVELMDCVSIAKAAGDVVLRRRSAERAFRHVGVGSRGLVEAAEAVVAAFLAGPVTLDGLREPAARASDWLVKNDARFRTAENREWLIKQASLLNEVLLLLGKPDLEDRARLCSRLRKVDRSDLGVEALQEVVSTGEFNTPALVTLGAAYCDLGKFQEAVDILDRVLDVEPTNEYALVALSRALRFSARPARAFDLAMKAFRKRVDEYTVRTMIAAAVAIDNQDLLAQAVAELRVVLANHTEGEQDIYLVLLGADELLEHGQLEPAGRIIEEIARKGVRGQRNSRTYLGIRQRYAEAVSQAVR